MNYLKIINKKYKIAALLLCFMSIAAVSAYVYETGQVQVTQTITNIATLTVSNSALGDIEEGQTITYTKADTTTLGDIVSLTTTKDGVYLNFTLSDTSVLTTYYSTYQIVVKFAAIGTGSTHVIGDVACTVTLGAPNPASVTLDKVGTWSFDFEVTTTAKSVSADQPTIATVTVTAQNA
jgi:hypothetical protein